MSVVRLSQQQQQQQQHHHHHHIVWLFIVYITATHEALGTAGNCQLTCKEKVTYLNFIGCLVQTESTLRTNRVHHFQSVT